MSGYISRIPVVFLIYLPRNWRQSHIQILLIPHNEDLLIIPSLRVLAQLQIEVIQHFAEDQSDLMISHATSEKESESVSHRNGGRERKDLLLLPETSSWSCAERLQSMSFIRSVKLCFREM